ncbi:metalloprotease domain containing protein [Bacteroides phage crAss001]|uniref:Metalloprotease domain containing protein n=1 Tax=Bacteroides phage crAss001 TaxID=2301731 RepID=A0A385DTC1_BPCA1|nr:metalloprotease domain containing protein [Bacteroides phage crAss001]AXQ62720.1 metalloprotease domain containing protein [Bacteroides phage crAss001]
MEEKKEVKPVLELVHRQDIFKIVIPAEVEKKIRFLCKNIWDVEWSGVLFYKVEGAFEDKSLTIRCVDLFQMDIGSSTYTEFNVSPDMATYMVDHPELLEEGIYQGLIHSHNNMATFFSGTDTATLSAEGNDMAHFVSLIVNNAGKYTAGVTRKYKCVQTVSEKYTYPTWNGEVKEGVETFDIEEEKLEWFNLDIVFENATNDFETEMMERIKEIKESKKKIVVPVYKGRNYYSQYDNYGKNITPAKEVGSTFPMEREKYYGEEGRGWYKAKEVKEIPVKQGELPFEQPEEENLDIPYGVVTVDADIVQSIVRQLVTSSIIISNESAVDVKKWANSMESLYRRRFGTVKEFEYFASNYVDYLINYTYDGDVMAVINNDDSTMAALLAHDVREELEKLPKNPWLSVYIKLMDDYII